MICPKCDSECWDNAWNKAHGKVKPNAPDFKCKNQDCGWLQWPDKKAGEPKPAGQSSSSQPAAPADRSLVLYRRFRWAINNVSKAYAVEEHEVSSEDLNHSIISMFIELNKEGINV